MKLILFTPISHPPSLPLLSGTTHQLQSSIVGLRPFRARTRGGFSYKSILSAPSSLPNRVITSGKEGVLHVYDLAMVSGRVILFFGLEIIYH